jgi:hypothetical protein
VLRVNITTSLNHGDKVASSSRGLEEGCGTRETGEAGQNKNVVVEKADELHRLAALSAKAGSERLVGLVAFNRMGKKNG